MITLIPISIHLLCETPNVLPKSLTSAPLYDNWIKHFSPISCDGVSNGAGKINVTVDYKPVTAK